MKTVGIIGGIGPESTIQYYRMILGNFKAVNKSSNNPNIIINSIDVNRLLTNAANTRLDELTDYLVKEILIN